MQKLLMIIGAALLLGGVTAAGTFASLGSGSDDNPSLSTEPISAATTSTTTTGVNHVRHEDRRQDRAAEARARANEPGEDVRGREAEPNDDRGGAADDNPGADDSSGRGSSNSGSGSGSDDGGHSGHDGGGDDD